MMNELDKEIEEFETTLKGIINVSKELKVNNDNIIKLLNETKSIDELKNKLNAEINKLDNINEQNQNTIKEGLDKINIMSKEINKTLSFNRKVMFTMLFIIFLLSLINLFI